MFRLKISVVGFHVVLKEEQNSFSDWINGNLQKMDSVKHLLPLHDEGNDLYEKVDDGIILWYVF